MPISHTATSFIRQERPSWLGSPSCLSIGLVALLGCAQAHDVDAPASPNGGGPSPASTSSDSPLLALDDECEGLRPDIPPKQLLCTGLYSDVTEKSVSPGVREFAPAVPFWSDGAEKQRWVYLPPDTQIDTSDPDNWIVPTGTRFFKEFKWKGKRVETRMYYKQTDSRWLKASYRWNDDETEAERFSGGLLKVMGDDYYIPEASECDTCHKGAADFGLGFGAAMLGLEGAEGVTLESLIEGGWISDPDTMADIVEVGDDGTGEAAKALTWLHINCGASCHSDNEFSEAFKTGLQLNLRVSELDGEDPSSAHVYRTAVGEDTTVSRWLDKTRIVPGDADASWLYEVIARRVPEEPADAMPPLATFLIDDDGVASVKRWIDALE